MRPQGGRASTAALRVVKSLWPSRGPVTAALSLLLVPGTRGGLAQDRPAAPSVLATQVAVTEHFAFHSDPWINLHHFLYHWARADEGLGEGRSHVPVPERGSDSALSNPDRRAWESALAFYRRAVAPRDHFDEQMLAQKRALMELGGLPQAHPADAIPGIARALAAAMPVYQARWWPDHDRANRGWIAEVVPLLRRHEARYVELTTRIHGAAWPHQQRRVDVSAYANQRAGYTAEGHIVIYSTDDGNQHLYGLETVVHEVQHTSEVGRSARERLRQAFDAAGVEPPPNLWHAVIFATAGEFVRAAAEAEGLPAHTPYFIREGFDSFRGWSTAVHAVQLYWLPVVRGEASVADGLAGLVRDVGDR